MDTSSQLEKTTFGEVNGLVLVGTLNIHSPTLRTGHSAVSNFFIFKLRKYSFDYGINILSLHPASRVASHL